VALLFFSRHPLIFSRRRGLWLLLLSLILVPATVGILKDTTNVACPRSLREFGGTLPYVHVFEAYPVQQRPARKQLCFPAGHASCGFALFALMYVFSSRRNRRLALAFGCTLGWLMGGYKMLIGDHFLSHTIVSMLLAWLLVSLLGLAEHTPAENLEKDR
jgi:membrane-associated PAP2 superfamily phosphatase